MRRREFTKTLGATIAVLLSPFSRLRLAHGGPGGATLVFGYPNGFAGAGSAIRPCSNAAISGSVLRLINDNTHPHNAAGAWYATKQPPTAFTTQFTFQPAPAAGGMTFCIQNTVSPPQNSGYAGTSYAGDANMCGYGGGTTQFPPRDSVAIKFDTLGVPNIQSSRPGVDASATGLYFNGGPSVASGGLGLCPLNDLNPYGLTFVTGHTYDVTIVYDGSLLTMVLLDTTVVQGQTVQPQARFAWPLNLANTTNANGNYVGFTAGCPTVATWQVLTWSYWSGFNTRLATPTFSPPPGKYAGTKTVAINYPAGSTCYYTSNGLLPTSSSTKYTGPITVSASEVIQAVAIEDGFTDSLVATGSYQINTANVINFPTGLSAGNLVTTGVAYVSGTAVRVTDSTNQTGAAWFPIPVNVAAFSTEFTLEWGSSGQGMCFVFQNNAPLYTSTTNNSSLTATDGYQINWSGGQTALAFGNGALGYGGINANGAAPNGTAYGLLNSVAIAFNQYGGGPDPANSVGLYTNGGNPSGSQMPTGLAFSSGNNGAGPSNPLKVSLMYDGTTLAFLMTDTVTSAKFTHSFAIDIPKTVGAETAYVGFTGGTGGAASIQSITAWTYTVSAKAAPAVPSAPTNLRVQ